MPRREMLCGDAVRRISMRRPDAPADVLSCAVYAGRVAVSFYCRLKLFRDCTFENFCPPRGAVVERW